MKRDLISGIFWIAYGLLVSLWATRYQIGTLSKPGSGFLPLGLGIFIIFFSLILLIQAKRSGPSLLTPPSPFARAGSKKIAYSMLILLLATFAFEKIGYLLTIFLLIISLMYGEGRRKWGTILLIASLSTIGVYLVFVLLLKQSYPRGPLGI